MAIIITKNSNQSDSFHFSNQTFKKSNNLSKYEKEAYLYVQIKKHGYGIYLNDGRGAGWLQSLI